MERVINWRGDKIKVVSYRGYEIEQAMAFSVRDCMYVPSKGYRVRGIPAVNYWFATIQKAKDYLKENNLFGF